MNNFRSSKIKIIRGLSVEFEYSVAARRMDVYWTPKPPTRFDDRVLRPYRAARDEFLQGVGERLGVAPVVIEITPEMLSGWGASS